MVNYELIWKLNYILSSLSDTIRLYSNRAYILDIPIKRNLCVHGKED